MTMTQPSVREYMTKIGRLGGMAKLKKIGPDGYRQMVKKYWNSAEGKKRRKKICKTNSKH